MKKIACFLLCLSILSCDDGDIIVDDLSFDNVSVQACLPATLEGNRSYLFYKVDLTNFESLSLGFTTSENFLFEDGTYGPFDIGNVNQVEYRKFTAAPGSDYFCSLLPPTTPNVLEVLTSRSGQFNLISTNQVLTSPAALANEESPSLDSDDDLIPNYLEPSGLDTDGDGLENKIDADDDGDNIPTVLEGVVIINGEISITQSRDTDGDGILDYLDADDDGDSILTVQEDLNRNLDPTDDLTSNGIPNYLDATINTSAAPAIQQFIPHSYVRTPILNIEIPVLTLVRGEETVVFDNFEDIQNFGTYTSPSVLITTTPGFVVPQG